MNVLETERLILRQFSAEDAGFILELLNEPSFIQNIRDRGVRTLADAAAYITRVPLASYAKNGFGLYAVLLKETNEGKIRGKNSKGYCLPSKIPYNGMCTFKPLYFVKR